VLYHQNPGAETFSVQNFFRTFNFEDVASAQKQLKQETLQRSFTKASHPSQTTQLPFTTFPSDSESTLHRLNQIEASLRCAFARSLPCDEIRDDLWIEGLLLIENYYKIPAVVHAVHQSLKLCLSHAVSAMNLDFLYEAIRHMDGKQFPYSRTRFNIHHETVRKTSYLQSANRLTQIQMLTSEREWDVSLIMELGMYANRALNDMIFKLRFEQIMPEITCEKGNIRKRSFKNIKKQHSSLKTKIYQDPYLINCPETIEDFQIPKIPDLAPIAGFWMAMKSSDHPTQTHPEKCIHSRHQGSRTPMFKL